MTVTHPHHNMQFLTGGGEMGELIRAKDWNKTPVGDPDNWPQSLRTTLSIILNSKFPMFLFWGPELICFYNDAYRPSLGNEGKHPDILGGHGEYYWKEIWHIIKPLIDQVLAGGEATWSEDQLIPIYRNGKIEDVYWTFSYSPVNDESGKPAGVFVTCSETTDKVLTLRKIGESEERFRTMAESSGILIAMADETSNATYFNKAWEELTGRPMEGLLKFGWADLIHADDREEYVNIYLNAFAKKETFTGEFRVLSKEGNYRWLLAKGPARFRPDGSFAGYISSCVDITELKQVDEALKESEKRLNLVIEASELGTWELNIKTREPTYSKRYLEILGGYKDDIKLTHTQLLQHLHPDDLHVREKAFKEAYVTGYLHYEARLIWSDQSIHWMEGRGKLFYDESNQPAKMIGTIRDITEEKNYQHALEESEQKFRLLADSMPQHIWTSDPEGNLNYYNRSVFDYSGLTLEQITKDGWLQIVHPDDREENIKLWAGSISTGKDFLFEHRFRRHDGEYRWQLSRAIPQSDPHGKIQMWVGTSTDIQDQKTFAKELEKQVRERTGELEEKNKELEKMNKELESFAYISSHDLQEPLRKIQTFSSQIIEQEYKALSNKGKDKFQRMQNAAKRMQTLIEDLLIYSRTSTAERKFEIVNLNKIIEEVKEDLDEESQQKNVTIEATEMCEVNIIPFQFRQLIYNLLSNSLKFSKDKQAPHIKIKSEIAKGIKFNMAKLSKEIKYCHISVSDNGIGFEPQYREKIFEVFQRLHGKTEYEGTGIGLAIVKKIVENHNGIITAYGEPGKGATFDIYFPQAEQ